MINKIKDEINKFLFNKKINKINKKAGKNIFKKNYTYENSKNKKKFQKKQKELDLKKYHSISYIPKTREEIEEILFLLYEYGYKDSIFPVTKINFKPSFQKSFQKKNNGHLIKAKNRHEYEIILEKKLFSILKIKTFQDYIKILESENKIEKIPEISDEEWNDIKKRFPKLE